MFCRCLSYQLNSLLISEPGLIAPAKMVYLLIIRTNNSSFSKTVQTSSTVQNSKNSVHGVKFDKHFYITDFVAVLLSSVGLLLLYRCNRLPSQLYFEPCILWKSLSLISWLQPLSSAFYLESYFNFAMVALVSVYFSFSFRYSESKFVKTAAFSFPPHWY